jgi:N-terminal region of glycosyl transferase group 7/N-terminal domain of galactosyltransferase
MESVPDIVFIVPYRNRQNQLDLFRRHMEQVILANVSFSYQILVVHQADERVFNRGALKNIGFLWCKEQWPQSYQGITLVFHDVDTMPYRPETIDYKTEPGRVKHFYGLTFALGGIVSIRAADFEKVGGFPNFWGWGFEDNCLNNRVKKATGMVIDRSQFYPMGSSEILHILDGFEKSVNRREFDEYLVQNPEGWASIFQIVWNPSDVSDTYTFLDVSSFLTGREEDKSKTKMHDVRNGPRPFEVGRRANRRWAMF